MKNINYLNYFFVGIPALIFLLAFLEIIDFTVFGLLFSILTGLFQVTIGGCMLSDEPKNKHLQTYIVGVVLYFVIICINPISSHDLKIYFLTGIPAILAFYISILIYKKAHK
ncbi:hypothetical protein [Flavobacterium branchiicola]|uniref:Uncharacterized protein n=1 Tax=Flavobacterium branchiicola TaxID=1114875 RepID=A0ABV9PF51_9FLAO|nr:hypothetical protein [Flavobacterium branchiicola]MBS7255361.1 hypothetical protein [Flavobacterium branchiicola]